MKTVHTVARAVELGDVLCHVSAERISYNVSGFSARVQYTVQAVLKLLYSLTRGPISACESHAHRTIATANALELYAIKYNPGQTRVACCCSLLVISSSRYTVVSLILLSFRL